MKQTAAIAFISIGIIALLGIAGYLFVQSESSKGSGNQTPTKEADSLEAGEEFNGIGTIDASLPQEMNEARLQFYLHEMIHSKVYAEDKWGAARPISQENIDNLLAIVAASDYKMKAFYRRTLEEWEKGDFVNAVDVHNKIWHMHRGTVGKATRLMTEEEEQAYIQAKF